MTFSYHFSPSWIPNRKRPPDCWAWVGWLMLPLTAVWNRGPGCWTGEEVVVCRFVTPFCVLNKCDWASSWLRPPCSEAMLDWGMKRPTGCSCLRSEPLPTCIGCCSWNITCCGGALGFPKVMGSERSCWCTVTILAWEKSREGLSWATRLLLVSGGICPGLLNRRLDVWSGVDRGLLQNITLACCGCCWPGERVFAGVCGDMFGKRDACWGVWEWSCGWEGCCCFNGLLCWIWGIWVWAWNTDCGSGAGVCRAPRKASCCCCALLVVSCDGSDVWGRNIPGVEGCWSADCRTVMVFWKRVAWTWSWDDFWNNPCGSCVSDKEAGLWNMGGDGCDDVCWRKLVWIERMSVACWKRAACCCCWACWKRALWFGTTPCAEPCCSALLLWDASWKIPHCIWICDWNSCCCKFSKTCCCWRCCCWICCFWICCWCCLASELSDWSGKLQKPLALRCLTASSSWATSSGGKRGSCCCWAAGSPQSLPTAPEPLPGLSCLRASLGSRRNCCEPCWSRESAGTEKELVAAMSCFWMLLKGSAWVKTGGWPLSASPAGWDRLLENVLFLFRCPEVASAFCCSRHSSPVCWKHKTQKW